MSSLCHETIGQHKEKLSLRYAIGKSVDKQDISHQLYLVCLHKWDKYSWVCELQTSYKIPEVVNEKPQPTAKIHEIIYKKNCNDETAHILPCGSFNFSFYFLHLASKQKIVTWGEGEAGEIAFIKCKLSFLQSPILKPLLTLVSIYPFEQSHWRELLNTSAVRIKASYPSPLLLYDINRSQSETWLKLGHFKSMEFCYTQTLWNQEFSSYIQLIQYLLMKI